MADNTTINSGAGGDTLRTDDVGGGVKVPVSKIHTGADGVDGGPVTTANPFPTQTQSGSLTALVVGGVINSAANPVPVAQQGTVTTSTTLVSGSQTGILVGSNPVAQSNPLPTRPMSGSQTGILMGSNPVDHSNPLAVTAKSGSQTGILIGANPVAASNPFPTQTQSGSLVGLMVGGVAVAGSNPVPVQSFSGSQTGILMGANPVAQSNPLAVQNFSGSQTGILVGSNPVAQSNPMPVLAMSGSGVSILVNQGSFGVGVPVSWFTRLPVYSMESSGQLLSGTVTTTVRYANSQLSSGSTQLVAPQPGLAKVRVLAVHAMNTTSVGAFLRWTSTGSAGSITNLSGYIPLAVSGGYVLPHNPHGWFETLANEGLNASLNSPSGGASVMITWIQSS